MSAEVCLQMQGSDFPAQTLPQGWIRVLNPKLLPSPTQEPETPWNCPAEGRVSPQPRAIPSCPPVPPTVPSQACSLPPRAGAGLEQQQQEMLLQSFYCLHNDCTALQDKKVLSYPVQEPTSIPIVPSHSLY